MSKVKVAEVQFHSWDRSYYFDPAGFDLKPGIRVIVDTSLGQEVGKIIGLGEVEESELEAPLQPINRIPTLEDLEHMKQQQEKRTDALEEARKHIRQLELPMKLIEASFSFDDQRIVFAFTANSRVDFRELVKLLSSHFHRHIRLQQIGSRDVAAEMGGIGPCGRPCCCSKWLRELGNVSSELIPLQQLEHRGSDRLSGLCGRLKCCLSFESEGYRMCFDKMPEVGQFIKTKTYGTGEVTSINVMKHTLTLRNEEGSFTEVPLGCDYVGCPGCSASTDKQKI